MALAVAGAWYSPGNVVEVREVWLAVGLILAVAAVTISISFAARTRRAAGAQLGHVRAATIISWYRNADEDQQKRVLLILDPSDVFGADNLVSIYARERLTSESRLSYERLVGLGCIDTVTIESRLQIVVLREFEREAPLWEGVRQRKAEAIGALVVKPVVPFHILPWQGIAG